MLTKVHLVKVMAFPVVMYGCAAAAKSPQSCPTLCDTIDGSPPGSPVLRILQARTLEWVAISFSDAWKQKVKGKLLSRVRLLATPWTTAYQAPLSMGFSRQEYCSGVPLPSLKFRLDMLNWIPLGSSRGGFERWSILFRGQVWAGMINIFVLCILGINWNSRSGLNDLI